MRLLMFRHRSSQGLGVLQGDQVVDVSALASAVGIPFVGNLRALVELGDDGLRTLTALLERSAESASADVRLPVGEVELLPPLMPAGNVLAIGRNYAEHAGEMGRARAEAAGKPTVFTKAQTTINAPNGSICVDPDVSSQIDWEAELGVVIGRTGRDIPPDAALEHVFGYTVVNDVSARDIQYGWGGQFFKGKSLDGYCPIGPWVVTRDEIPDPQCLRVTLRVNGITKQDGNTRDMIFPVERLVADLSKGMTLPAFSLIATGTPPGVGYAREPKEFLRPGDLMETEVEGIGVLRNPIVGP
ncbi:MAG TPA: fumarylacetoacetate hydrolase family protein [Chloroflexota bacterium]|nr:fumarylacetoacetate hydrolase family protein [Chloroflexota bacterium]